MSIRTIPRESGDTSKGFTLQKLRTTSLMLSHINDSPSIDFFAAVEYGGDVYLDNKRVSYLEENKAYVSKNFSFSSSEIKNTLVYFLDHWLNNNRNTSIRFGFYTTNDTAKEINAGVVKDLAIELPEQSILKLLSEKKYTEKNLLSAVKKIILNEYQDQYTGNTNFSLKESYYSTIEKFSDEDWKTFLKTIEWKFQQESIEALEAKVIQQIAGIKFPGMNTDGRERFIRAELFYELEIRQTKTKSDERFITKDFIELTFRRVATSGINDNSYKFLSLDYDEIRQKTKQNLQQLISDKYRAVTGNTLQPFLLHRKVALYDPSIKISSKRTESREEAKDYRVEGLFRSFVNSEKPIFLFGELGSGKSTIVANYLLSLIDEDAEMVPLFLPSAYLHDKDFNDTESLVAVIKRYINNELPLIEKFFDFDTLLKLNKEAVLIIDGIDELPINRSRNLIATLKKLKESSSHLRIIATGRPLELENILPIGWHTLSTIPLKDDEIKTLFFQEAIANNIGHSEAHKDTQKRFGFLKNRNELYAIATTPLIICSIWPDLTDTLQAKSLGNILYDVLLRRLSWHEKDQKEMDIKVFLEYFPNIYQREELLGILAKEIFYSDSKAIPDSTIFKIISSKVPESVDKNKIVHEASIFFKNIFLQQTTNDKYGFVSAPLLECAAAITIADELKSEIKTLQSERFFLNWRALSFSMAIARQKEETDQVRNNISVILEKELRWPNVNVAPVSIIIAELRDSTIANRFIDILSVMVFRPLRTMEQNDQLTLYSLAYCLTLSGDKGFDWFYCEYLNCKTPLIHYEAKMVSDILAYYLLINDFTLSSSKQERLDAIIKPNISFATSLCFELVPCLSLIANDALPVKQKCLLLADLLKDDILHIKAESVLIGIATTNPTPVLDALETVCQKTEFTEIPRAAFLWLQINKQRSLSLNVLHNILTSITRAKLEETYLSLAKYIKQEDLDAYLRYSIVLGNKLAGQASLILFWRGEKNFDLLSNALITSIDWLSQQYGEINEIAEFIGEKKEAAVEILIKNMPLSNHLGVPPSYWRIFLDSLNNSDELYLSAFAKLVDNLRPYILTRYPDIRIRLTTTLSNKPTYKDELKKMSKGLNTGLRNNANAILLTCFPSQEVDALKKTIAGFFKTSSGQDEWQSFCLSLNYDKESLEKLYKSLEEFVEGSKTYALILLYYHKHNLNEAGLDELVKGLLGPGYFFDRRSLRLTDWEPGILSQADLFERIIPYLTFPETDRAERAASVLLDYHNNKLSIEEKAISWTLRIESFEDSFFEFSLKHECLLNDPKFVEAVFKYSKDTERESLLSLFCKTIEDPKAWKSFLIRIITKSERFTHDILFRLHHWLVSHLRRFPAKKTAIAEALSELLLTPAYKESSQENNVYQFLLLIADDFSVSNREQMLRSLQLRHNFANEELLLSLALRSDFSIPTSYFQSAISNHITLFTQYNPTFISQVAEEELDRLLVDTENLPKELLPKSEQIILFGQLEEDQLEKISSKSILGAYFSMLVSFCRNKKVQIEKLLEIREIGGVKVYQLPETKIHRKIIQKFYLYLLNDKVNREIYINTLKKELNNPNTEHFDEYLHELIAQNEKIEFKHFEKLLELLLDRPYLLKEELAYYLSDYFAADISQEDEKLFKEAIQKFLQALINHFEKESLDDRYNLILWLFSLALLKVTHDVSDIARDSFLLGLRYVFLEKNSMDRALLHPPEIFFRAKDLFYYTNPLFAKIDSIRIKSIIEYGVESNVPEISSCCRILKAFSTN